MKHKYYSGGFILVIGVLAAFRSWHYHLDSLAHMGPGYYPFALAILLILCGLTIAFGPEIEAGVQDKKARKPLSMHLRQRARPWTAVTLGIVVMVFVGEYFGMVPAIFLCVFIVSLGDAKNTVLTSTVLAIAAVLFTVVVFSMLLQIPMPLFLWPD